MSRHTTLAKEDLLVHLHLLPHPEGGYYAETYRATEMVNCSDGRGLRAASTSILFLLGQGDVSHLHRIKSDEMWNYHHGGSLVIFELNEETKSFRSTILGPDVIKGQVLQYVVPANTWFGAYLDDPEAEYSLVGCTVAPGFDFADFELGDRAKLIAAFPGAIDPINRLTDNPELAPVAPLQRAASKEGSLPDPGLDVPPLGS